MEVEDAFKHDNFGLPKPADPEAKRDVTVVLRIIDSDYYKNLGC